MHSVVISTAACGIELATLLVISGSMVWGLNLSYCGEIQYCA